MVKEFWNEYGCQSKCMPIWAVFTKVRRLLAPMFEQLAHMHTYVHEIQKHICIYIYINTCIISATGVLQDVF